MPKMFNDKNLKLIFFKTAKRFLRAEIFPKILITTLTFVKIPVRGANLEPVITYFFLKSHRNQSLKT